MITAIWIIAIIAAIVFGFAALPVLQIVGLVLLVIYGTRFLNIFMKNLEDKYTKK